MTTRTWLSPVDLSFDVVRAHFPFGHAWIALMTAGKVMYLLVKAMAQAFEDGWAFLGRTSTELDYRTGEQFLIEWETALALPDPCLPSDGTAADRRKWIAFRLNKRRWTTLADWYELAALFGLSVRIVPGYLVQEPSLFRQVFPIPIRRLPKLGRFRVYIDVLGQEFGGFPYDGTSLEDHKFPIPFGAPDGEFNGFRCLIERVKPANVLIVWNEFPAIPPHGTGYTFTDDFDTEFS